MKHGNYSLDEILPPFHFCVYSTLPTLVVGIDLQLKGNIDLYENNFPEL